MVKVRVKVDTNCQKFYQRHPDLTPRNIYLAMGRVSDNKETERIIENIGEPFLVRAKNWCKYLFKSIFNKV